MHEPIGHAVFQEYVGDSYENIQQCLNCPYPKCINCLDHPEASAKFADRVFKPRQYRSGVNRNSLSRVEKAVLDLYINAESDRSLADELGSYTSYITYVRNKLGLPALKYTPREDRIKLVQEIMKKVDSSEI